MWSRGVSLRSSRRGLSLPIASLPCSRALRGAASSPLFGASRRSYASRQAQDDDSEQAFQRKINAFAARVGIDPNDFAQPEALSTAFTHPSFSKDTNNSRFEFIGDRVLSLTVCDYLYKRYPKAPANVLSSACHTFCGNKYLFGVAQRLGITDMVRWQRKEELPDDEQEDIQVKSSLSEHSSYAADAVEALIGAIYTQQGANKAYEFIQKHVVPESAMDNLATYLRVLNPKRTLFSLLRKRGDGRPYYKILQESGRYSSNSIYIVGVFSDAKQLGEGAGRSIKAAEDAAAQNAIDKEWGEKAYRISDAELSAYGLTPK